MDTVSKYPDGRDGTNRPVAGASCLNLSWSILRFSSAVSNRGHRDYHCSPSWSQEPFASPFNRREMSYRQTSSLRFECVFRLFFIFRPCRFSSHSICPPSPSRARRRIHFYRCVKLCVFSSGFPRVPLPPPQPAVIFL